MQRHIQVIDILKKDITDMDYGPVRRKVWEAESDKEILESEKNSWEITFSDYAADPRPLPDIPEVVTWINGSVDAGIPWFYFLRTGILPQSLQLLLACGAKTADPGPDGSYLIDINKFKAFVTKNFNNLNAFMEKNSFSYEAGIEITDAVIRIIKEMMA